MSKTSISRTEKKNIDSAIATFRENRHLFETFAQALMVAFENSERLSTEVHFMKYRIKDPNHLHRKLERKTKEDNEKGVPFEINGANLFEMVTDLAGIRLIHLNTEQMRIIHPELTSIFSEQKYRLVESPAANCWDVEYEKFFSDLGIVAQSRESMYTTVHYVVEANSRTKITCEIQVRTLMDEVWGEVSHRINYPEESSNALCKDQLKVLARLTTGCARLVDSIFKTDLYDIDD